ncbi:MAG: hypothetical protein N2971_08925, partial [Chlorobi bacterium]|nr:hypothetical protein [Chlorobiota bacterium]
EYDPHRVTLDSIVSTLVERTDAALGHSDRWRYFLRPGEVIAGLPERVATAELVSYEPAPDEHQWFLRKAGFVRRTE